MKVTPIERMTCGLYDICNMHIDLTLKAKKQSRGC